MTSFSTSSRQGLDRRRLHIKMRLATEHLTSSQRLKLEKELWRLENQIDGISSYEDYPHVELRGQSLRN